jgi:aspartyl-tRNA(Asn)/glutamyl-tRNA(Gln) amidotransferase subunit A
MLIDGKLKISDLVIKSKNKYLQNKLHNDVITPLYEQAEIQANKLEEMIPNNKDNLLFGIPYSLKDNISTNGIRTTGGSKFLENYIPPYDATVYKLLKNTNAILVNKASLDEFGMGGTGLLSAYGYVHNIHDDKRITGGSSSGSVNQVASNMVVFSIGSDTGDSIRRTASFVGVVGYKPTYGLISRYGMLPYAPSLDCLGINSNNITDCAIVAQHIIKFDERDFSSQKINDSNFYNNLKKTQNISICVVKNIIPFLQQDVIAPYQKSIDILKSHGCSIVEKEIPEKLLNAILPTYRTISYAESSSCYANLTGINFGLNEGGKTYEDMLLKNRTKGIGHEVKKRIVIGELLTNRDNFKDIFLRAKKVRTLLVNTYNSLLDGVDCLLLPSASSIAPLIEDVINKTA